MIRIAPIVALAVLALFAHSTAPANAAADGVTDARKTRTLTAAEQALLDQQSRRYAESFLKAEYLTEWHERVEIRMAVERMMINSDHLALELVGRAFRDKRQRTRSGVWRLTFYYGAFRDLAPSAADDETSWLELFKTLKAWRTAFPKSSLPIIASSILLEQRGRKLMAGGMIPDAAAHARNYLDAAYAFLVENEAIAEKDPHYFYQLAAVAYAKQAGPNAFMELILRGIETEPEYYQLYFLASLYFSPRVFGDWRQVEAIADMAVSNTRKTDGEGLYARVYWYAGQTHNDIAMFRHSKLDWPRMRKGIDNVLAQYPDKWNVNNFAYFACVAGDAAKTKELMTMMGDKPMRSVWNKVPGAYKKCSAWSGRSKDVTKVPKPEADIRF